MREERNACAKLPDPSYLLDPLRHLDFKGARIGAIIWATGYGDDYGWINMPVLDARGEPAHRHGV